MSTEKTKVEQNEDQIKDQTLEQSFEELESLIGTLGEPGISLEDSFALYEKGIKLVQSCNKKLDQVEKKMLCITQEGALTEF